MTNKIFITGAAGFIGFHLALRLAKLGKSVLGFDNFNNYYSPNLKQFRAKILNNAGIKVIEGDLCDARGLKEAINLYAPSHVVNLAAQAGVRYSIVNPQAYIQSNLEGFLNILEALRDKPHTKLIYASSSSVYGTNTKIPFSVNDQTDHQASFYGVTKKANELMASSYHHLYGFPVTGLRFFTVYGPWGRPDMAYFSFTKAILTGQPITVYNEGHMERDFTYIDDIIDGIIAAIELGAASEIFNLGNHRPVNLNYFITLLENELGKKALKHFLPMQAGDVLSTYADITHSQDKLQFFPRISIEEGVKRFVSWYRDHEQHGW